MNPVSGLPTTPPDTTLDTFIARWASADGSERANYQLFITELCALLDLPLPDPAQADAGENAYCFERRINFAHGDGSHSNGFIDCYRRGAFVLEAKKLKAGGARSFDDALMRARGQAEGYARALPADEGRPPFLVVVDVGNVIELYAEFTRSGATYTPYPDPRSHRIALADLHQPDIRERLRQLWLEPDALDPTRKSARVTREIAAHLAELAKSLEASGHGAEDVAGFLTRCLFSLFAEDVQLLPKGAFTGLLHSLKSTPEQIVPLIGELWATMDKGGFSVAVREQLPYFNGKLFKQPKVLPLTKAQLDLLLEAGKANWTEVEPAIFGTLLERALSPTERHALGAHYTPRAYVERLVLPTVIEPLRAEWQNIQAAALLLVQEEKHKDALAQIRAFHHTLCNLRVLDPACGSGNFLYVTLEHMKRLEGEVLNQLHEFGAGQGMLETEGLTVDPHQFLGLELNPHAAAIAELVLWIGYLQWHFRTKGSGLPPQPVLRDFRNIENRDAVLAYDNMEYVMDAQGKAVSRWDGKTFKQSPVTGADVPDESAQVPLERYVNPRRAEWPPADIVIGNPPFIGDKKLRATLGEGYVDALRSTWADVPESTEFVMFWWHHAAQLVAQGKLQRFGFITTNSISQTFNRRVVQAALDKGVHLAFAIPDHPWVDSADGAAVRIAMTVADGAASAWKEATTEDTTETPLAYWAPGRLLTAIEEKESKGDGVDVTLIERSGEIHADLRVGANVSSVPQLCSNGGVSTNGFMLAGSGFIVPDEQISSLGKNAPIKHYRNGRDLTDSPRNVGLIDCFGLTAEVLREKHPAVYQWLLERVKPERDQNKRKRLKEEWWIFAEPRKTLRKALVGLSRYIATVETAKHRVFQFLDASIAPDHMLIAIAIDDAYTLGVLSSRVHVVWALAAGGTLEDRPRYNKSRCFETFPFPVATPEQQAHIRALAEQLDAYRKQVLAEHSDLTLTGLYNVLEKLRSGADLNKKEKDIHARGLVSVLKSLHDELDAAVLAAYDWQDHPDEETLLTRLVELNAQRAAEEAAGTVRWLRPEFQNPQAAAPTATQTTLPVEIEDEADDTAVTKGKAAKPAAKTAGKATEKQPWPAALPEQMAAVARVLVTSPTPLTLDALAASFSGKGQWKKRLPQITDTLVALGRAREQGDAFSAV